MFIILILQCFGIMIFVGKMKDLIYCTNILNSEI